MARDATYAILWLFVFTVPWQNVVVLESVGSLSRAVGLGAAALGLLTMAVDGRRTRFTEAHTLLLLFVLWIAVTGLWSDSAVGVRVNVGSTMQFLVLVLLIHEFATTRSRQRSLLGAFVAGCAVASLSTIGSALADPGGVRHTVAGSNENALALTLALSLPMAWYLSGTTRRPAVRWLTAFHVPLAMIGVMLTGSRSGLVLIAIGSTTLLLSPGRRLSRRLVPIGLVVVLLAIANTALVPSATRDRLSTTGTELTEGDLGSRQPLWEESIDVLASQPLFGVGVGASSGAVRHANGARAVPHNTYLTIAADTGLVGLVLFLLVPVSIGITSRSLPAADRRLLLVTGLVLGVGLGGLHLAYQKLTWLILGLMANHGGGTDNADVLSAPVPDTRPVPRREAASHVT